MKLMHPKTFEVVMAVAAIAEPFTVRDLYAAASSSERATVTRALGWMVVKRWLGPPDGRKRPAGGNLRCYQYKRTEKFPRNPEALKVFRQAPAPKPARPLFRRTEMDRRWEELKATFGTRQPSIDELMGEEAA